MFPVWAPCRFPGKRVKGRRKEALVVQAAAARAVTGVDAASGRQLPLPGV